MAMQDKRKIVEINHVDKYFGKNHVVKDLNMSVAEGEFLSILGPSGCGKTTTLRMIAGFEHQTNGEILVEGERVENKEPFDRNVNTVFQSYALFPHMTVYENIAFGLKMKKTPKRKIASMVDEVLKMVQLEGYEKRYPGQLSGGQKQRVAIARAIVNQPRVLLLDEPLGALDLKLRKQMQIELKHLQRKLGITFIYVTHDQEEAMTMSDRIAVMHEGVLEQIDVPKEVYAHPKSKFVADFIGESNLFDAVVNGKENDICYMGTEAGDIVGIEDKEEFQITEFLCVSVRPEKMQYSKTPVEGFNLKGIVRENINIGTLMKSIVVLRNGQEVKLSTISGQPFPESGSEIYLYWNISDAVLMKTDSDRIHSIIEHVDLDRYIKNQKDFSQKQLKVMK
jgi:spermidine/putrescine transport system ATP-binding protein